MDLKQSAEVLIRQARQTITNRFLLGCALIALPWFVGSSYLWSLNDYAWVSPLSAKPFELPFKLLLQHRLIWSPNLIQPFLVFYSFLPVLILILIFAMIYWSLHVHKRFGIAIALSLFFFNEAAPGADPSKIVHSLMSIALLVPFFRTPNSLFLWATGSLGVLAAYLDSTFQFPLFWVTSSLIFGCLMHFLLGERGVASRKIKVLWAQNLLQFFALSLLGLWILLSILSLPPEWTLFQPSRLWPLAWLVTLQCIVLAYYSPESTNKWLARGILAQGLCLSQSLEFFVVALAVGSGVEIFFGESLGSKIMEKIPNFLKQAFHPLVVTGALVFMSFKIYHFDSRRDFDGIWASIPSEMNSRDVKGYLIVGTGLPFLAHFVHKPLVSDDQTLLVMEESALLKQLGEYNVSDIIVDKKYLIDFWRNWIETGKPADIANLSVISRAITYQGQELETSTLKFPALRELEKIEYQTNGPFVWLRIKSNSKDDVPKKQKDAKRR